MLQRSLWMLAVAVLPLQALATDAGDALRGALTCDGDPLSTLQTLAAEGSAGFDRGHAGFEFGEEIDTKSVVVLREPLVIAGASTTGVIGGPAHLREDFGALVQARFDGDWKPVAKALKLAPAGDGNLQRRALENDSSGSPNEVCPMTIELLPLDDGGFLLGCGWCNG